MISLKDLFIEIIKKQGNNYNVYTKDGKKKLGTHKSKKSAQKQLAAIEISKHKHD